jgi:hypothetical protein
MAKLSKDATVVNARILPTSDQRDYANVYRVEKSAEALDYTDETLLYQFKRIPLTTLLGFQRAGGPISNYSRTTP